MNGLAAPPITEGIHHITAIAADPQPNLDFYIGFLGLRLVKRTVNFDDPGTYHFYYGDQTGRPGTILTFFPWPGARQGRTGTGQVTAISFVTAKDSLGFWRKRGKKFGIDMVESEHFGQQVLQFSDPDGLSLEIAGYLNRPAGNASERPGIPAEHAFGGFHSATISEAGFEKTAQLLTQTMGFHSSGQDEARFRFVIGDAAAGKVVDIVCAPDAPSGLGGAGTVHHIAWRTPDETQQRLWQEALRSLGYDVTPVMDRNYFKSIYFREPGGVLFEIATDPPGFLIDEAVNELGHSLKLPPQYERQRGRIEQVLPKITLP